MSGVLVGLGSDDAIEGPGRLAEKHGFIAQTD